MSEKEGKNPGNETRDQEESGAVSGGMSAGGGSREWHCYDKRSHMCIR